MLVEQIIKQTVDLQGFRVDTVTKDPDGLIAKFALIPGTEYAVEHVVARPSTVTCVTLAFSAMCLCGILRCGSAINLAGCTAPDVAASARSNFPG